MNLEDYIRTIPDFPKPGINYKDFTPLLNDARAFHKAVSELYKRAYHLPAEKVIGIESRGFILGAALADRLQAGFVPVRKSGKLPAQTVRQTYKLEYGTDTLEIHSDAIDPGDKVIIHDDLLATGGTALAACQLVEKLGGEVVQVCFFIELTFLEGKKHLKNYLVDSVLQY